MKFGQMTKGGIMIKLSIVCSVAVILAGCGETEVEEALATEPTGYNFAIADLQRAVPDDICRSQNPQFVQNVMDRINRALPAGDASARFERFIVHDSTSQGAREAIVRFAATHDGEPGVKMHASAEFEPGSCEMTNMIGYVGAAADPWSREEYEQFAID